MRARALAISGRARKRKERGLTQDDEDSELLKICRTTAMLICEVFCYAAAGLHCQFKTFRPAPRPPARYGMGAVTA